MADVGRTKQAFPSRQYVHRYARRPGMADGQEPVLEAGRNYRFVLGRDASPVPLETIAAAERPGDPFGRAVLLHAQPAPLSLRTLLQRFDALPGTDALPQERSFMVADGGQIAWTPETDTLERSFRLVVVRQGAAAGQPDILISASTDLDSDEAFLQVIGWDATARAYQFYDRRKGAWIWAGSSWDALAPGSRGQGPFDSHVNGALNMKELKAPWVHWHSQAAAMLDSVLAPQDPFRDEPLWRNRRQAEEFERTVARPGVQRWTAARVARCQQGQTLTRLPEFFRQVLETTTVNLASSPTSNAALATARTVRLPTTFFFNADALVGELGLAPRVTVPEADGNVYRAALQEFDVAITDGVFRFPGDTFFVFVVPEPALEDVEILRHLLDRGVLSRKLAASMLMVDFCNAVSSPRRSRLLKYVAASAPVDAPHAFDAAFIGAVEASAEAGVAGSAEAELLANWSRPDAAWEGEFAARITRYMNAIAPSLRDAARFSRIFELAESRRREYRTRALGKEFRLNTPITNIPETAPPLEFVEDGTVRPR